MLATRRAVHAFDEVSDCLCSVVCQLKIKTD